VSANLDLVRSIYADWERGEFNPRPKWADPGIEFEVPDGPEPSTRTGQASSPGIEAFLNLWEELRFEAEEYRELGDGSVFVRSRMTGRGKGSGVEVDQRRASLFQVDEGRVTRLALYWDRDRAFADLGLTAEGEATDPSG
jgi:ketosteroid isomerase-like protein